VYCICIIIVSQTTPKTPYFSLYRYVQGTCHQKRLVYDLYSPHYMYRCSAVPRSSFSQPYLQLYT
jgi:hypothetical protein